jgi:hypothetical protein
VENVQNRHLKDVQNARIFGIVHENAKFQTGQIINRNVIRNLNNLKIYSKNWKKIKISKKLIIKKAW